MKTKKIRSFHSELERTKQLGFIHSYTELTNLNGLGKERVVGVEILFNDKVSDKQILLIKNYVEYNYMFDVDDYTLNEYGKLPKIIMVWYYD